MTKNIWSKEVFTPCSCNCKYAEPWGFAITEPNIYILQEKIAVQRQEEADRKCSHGKLIAEAKLQPEE